MVRMKKALLSLGMVGMLAATVSPAQAEPPKVEVQEVADTGSMPKGALLSHDGKKFYVTNFGQLDKRNVTIYDARTLALVDQIDVPGVIVESALSADGKTLFISNFRRNSVMFVDLASKKVTHEIKTGRHPKVLVASPDGKSLFAANWASKSVTQIDIASAEVVRTLDVGKQPRGMVMTKGGKLYVANFFGDSIDVFEGKELETTHRLATCKCPRHLALSPDEKTLYVSYTDAPSKIVKYVIAADGAIGAGTPFVAITPGDSLADGLAVDSSGNVYVALKNGVDVFKADGTKWGHITTTKIINGLAFGGADKKTLFMTSDTGLLQVTVKIAGLTQ